MFKHIFKNPRVGDMRVWHCPQVPMASFYVPVGSVDEAKRLIAVLGHYDAFQYDNRVKGDYCNTSGLEVYESDNGDGVPGWCEWYDEQTGDDVHARYESQGTTNPPTVEELAADMKREINEDILHMDVPASVASFGELHDYVDANCYGGFCNDKANPWAWVDGALTQDAINLIDAAAAIVDTWLANGRKEEA